MRIKIHTSCTYYSSKANNSARVDSEYQKKTFPVIQGEWSGVFREVTTTLYRRGSLNQLTKGYVTARSLHAPTRTLDFPVTCLLSRPRNTITCAIESPKSQEFGWLHCWNASQISSLSNAQRDQTTLSHLRFA